MPLSLDDCNSIATLLPAFCPDLQQLSLQGVSISPAGAHDLLQSLAKLTALRVLYLGSCKYYFHRRDSSNLFFFTPTYALTFCGSIEDKNLQYLPLVEQPALTSISRLYLHGNSIGPMTSAMLGKGLPNCLSLQLLWLQRCNMRDSDFSLLSQGLKSLTHLHTLDLSVNFLTDGCVPSLALCLPCMHSLLSLR